MRALGDHDRKNDLRGNKIRRAASGDAIRLIVIHTENLFIIKIAKSPDPEKDSAENKKKGNEKKEALLIRSDTGATRQRVAPHCCRINAAVRMGYFA
ncbi:hypothetical protein AH97_22920 [Salmonella enterica subsp. enterica]|nr:hypothetical protein [Salmonella enterica subsp. enterica serovar Hartford]